MRSHATARFGRFCDSLSPEVQQRAHRVLTMIAESRVDSVAQAPTAQAVAAVAAVAATAVWSGYAGPVAGRLVRASPRTRSRCRRSCPPWVGAPDAA